LKESGIIIFTANHLSTIFKNYLKSKEIILAFDTFLKIDGIDGESSDHKHQGWIELVSYYTGLHQKVSKTASSAGGASAERVDFNSFTFTKLLDKASPKLALACADGTHFDTILVELCRAGTEKMVFMRYQLSNCLIQSFETGGTQGEDLPSEDVEISFGKIEWRYTLQNRVGGGPAGNMVSGWNLQKNAIL
jgi:type VI secretion system secreted protein Hcp